MELRERLAMLRRGRGLTLRELRDRIEARTGERMSISYLSELERLETTPSLEVLTRIARGYDLSIQELLAPVAFGEQQDDEGRYPPSLREFQRAYGIDDGAIADLALIRFRGRQPQTVEEWHALYSVLELFRGEPPSEGR